MLYKNNFVIFLTGFVVVMISCKDKISSEEKPMAKVNDYVITRPPTKIAEMLCHYIDREISQGNF